MIEHVGFTGTRKGMTPSQSYKLALLLTRLKERGAVWLHSGDCIGADREAFEISSILSYRQHGYPPAINTLRSFCGFEVTEYPQDYLVRNRHIVSASDVLIATPNRGSSQRRSGTWFAIRHARFLNKPTIVISDDGSTNTEGIK